MDKKLPRAKEYISQKVGDELLVFSGEQAHCLAKTSAQILEFCRIGHTRTEALGLLSGSALPSKANREQLEKVLDELGDRGLIEYMGPPRIPEMGRRAVLGTAALAITSVLVPRPALAASGCHAHGAANCPRNSCLPCSDDGMIDCGDCTCFSFYCADGNDCTDDTFLGTACIKKLPPTIFPAFQENCAGSRAAAFGNAFQELLGNGCAEPFNFNCGGSALYGCCAC